MESRHYFAYGLILVLLITALIGGIVHYQRRAARKRRMRGIKDYQRR